WVVEFGWPAAALFYATSGIFLFLVYNLWAEGFPWYLADSYNLGTFVGYYDYAHVLCWVSLLVVLRIAWRRIFPPEASAREWKPAWKWMGALAAAIAVLAVVPEQLPTPQPMGFKYDDTVRYINARSYLELAGILADQHRYLDSMQLASEAKDLSPDWGVDAARIIEMDKAAMQTN